MSEEEDTTNGDNTKKKRLPCIVNKDHGESRKRGLCNFCFKLADELVTQGKTTWEELESAGMAKTPKHRSDKAKVREDFLAKLEAFKKVESHSLEDPSV